MDTDPVKGSTTDFTCGTRTFDNHKGTDFAIRDWLALEEGVSVLAAADGTVKRKRDGMKDKIISDKQRRNLLEKGFGCGNAASLGPIRYLS